jgi:photosystem II stability/assembly factor-like uncharacterized protein
MAKQPIRMSLSTVLPRSLVKFRTLAAFAGLAGALSSAVGDFVRFDSRRAAFPPPVGFVSVIDSEHIWVGLTHTVDGGHTWKAFSPSDPPSNVFIESPPENQATTFINDTRGFLRAYDSLWITRDGGHTWSKLFDGAAGVAFRNGSTGSGGVQDRERRLQTYYISHDAGETWQKCGESPISEPWPSGSASFVSEATGWSPVALFNERQLPGRNGVARTDDGGCHWRLLAWYDADRIARVTFADASAGWLLPADPDPIARTLDGGSHWKQLKRPIAGFNPETGYLQDRGHGWVYGSSALLQGDGSGMYFTSDLGDTWQSISKTDLRLNRGLARDIPLAWSDGYFAKMVQQRRYPDIR